VVSESPIPFRVEGSSEKIEAMPEVFNTQIKIGFNFASLKEGRKDREEALHFRPTNHFPMRTRKGKRRLSLLLKEK